MTRLLKGSDDGGATTMPRQTLTRRYFVAGTAASVAVFAAGPRRVDAQDMPRLTEDDATAVALKYVHDASAVSSELRSGERFCNNCALFAGEEGADWAPCSIFPGKLVSGSGWCSVWAPKQGG